MGKSGRHGDRSRGLDKKIDTSSAQANRNGNIGLDATIEDGPPWWRMLDLPKITYGNFAIGDREENSADIWQLIKIPSLPRDVKVNISVDIEVPQALVSSNPFFTIIINSGAYGVVVSTKRTLLVYFWPDQVTQPVRRELEFFKAERFQDGTTKISQPASSSFSLEIAGTATPATTQLIVIIRSELTVERLYPPPPPDLSSLILIGNDPGGQPTVRVTGISVTGR